MREEGHDHVAVRDNSGENLSVLLNLGNSTFAAPANYRVDSSLTSVLALDLNSDGKPDLAIANNGSNNVRRAGVSNDPLEVKTVLPRTGVDRTASSAIGSPSRKSAVSS